MWWICPLMMLILRGVRAGLLAMLPNVAPATLVFGGMGWLGHEVDIGSVAAGQDDSCPVDGRGQ